MFVLIQDVGAIRKEAIVALILLEDDALRIEYCRGDSMDFVTHRFANSEARYAEFLRILDAIS